MREVGYCKAGIMTLSELGNTILAAAVENHLIECGARQVGVLYSGVITITSKDTVQSFTTAPVYVSADIACGGVTFLVDTIKKLSIERKPVKSWEAEHREIKDVRLSA